MVWRLQSRGELQRIGIVNFVTRTGRLARLALGVAVFLSTFGIDVTAGLAALGIGGLALALGARKAVEDLVGSIMVLAGKPVRIGDRCKVNGRIGDVVDVGMRSTRIRTRERRLLTIPKSQFADAEIENLTLRDRFFVDQIFGVGFDVQVAGVEAVLTALRSVLEEDPDYIPTACPVRCLGFKEGLYTFQIHSYLQGPTYAEGFVRQERLLLELLRRLDAIGVSPSPPLHRIDLSERSPGASRDFPHGQPGANPD